MNLLRSMIASVPREPEERGISFDALNEWFGFGSHAYPLGLNQTMGSSKVEEIDTGFTSISRLAYKQNGVVFACMLSRMLLFSEARFQFRRLANGRPVELFGTPELAILERPWLNATTGDLLGRVLQDADLAGNAFVVRRTGDQRVSVARPDWMTIILGVRDRVTSTADDLDADVLGYVYLPGGSTSKATPVYLTPGEVAHFMPIPDPLARHRGMSWIEPVIREVMGDQAATSHKLKFFSQGATPNLVVAFDQPMDRERFKAIIEEVEKRHTGLENAYRTLYLSAGAKAQVVGSDLRQIDFKQVQGAGETRIAAAAGVPPVIVGLSEGLQAATYSNYAQARRRFADGTIRPLWRNLAGSLESIVRPPIGAQLWYDDRDVPALREDVQDIASIQQTQANAIRSLVDAGFDPISVVKAIEADDMSLLSHSGLYSVQLQAPGTGGPAGDPTNA